MSLWEMVTLVTLKIKDNVTGIDCLIATYSILTTVTLKM